MNEFKNYTWLVKTDKGEFFMSVSGEWTEAEAALRVMQVFRKMNLEITGMDKKSGVPEEDNERAGAIIQELWPQTSELGYKLFAGRKYWELCGRIAEFDAEMVLSKVKFEEIKNGAKGIQDTG